jgi:hypothetical protein
MSTDPREMLCSLNDRACPQKLRQFALTCCRRIWDHLDEAARSLLVLAERYCNGEGVSKSKLKRARQRLRLWEWPFRSAGGYAARAVRAAAWLRIDEPHGAYSWLKAAEAADSVAQVLVPDEARGKDWVIFSATTEWREDRAAQAQLLREVSGDPFGGERQSEPDATADGPSMSS